MPLIIIRRDGVVQQRVTLTHNVTTVGRLEDNHIVLGDGSVSRRHAQIERQGDQFVIRDLGSQNGIWVAGSRVPQATLQPGVPMTLGVFTLQMEGAGAGAAPPVPEVAGFAPSRAKLFVADGPMAQQEFSLLQPEVRLGRSSSCEIPVEHDAVSKQHAKIAAQGGQYVLTDTGSRNGVFVNGQRIDSRVLQHGDEIVIGPVRFLFSETGEYVVPSGAPASVGAAASSPQAIPASSFPGYAASPAVPKASFFAKVPKVVWIGGGLALVLVILLIAIVSGPTKSERSGGKDTSTETQQTIQRLLAEGNQYFTAGDYQGALEKANAVLVPEIDPTNRGALDLQARAQEKIREQEAQRLKAEQEAAGRATKAQSLLNDANAAFKTKDYEKSRAKLEEARTLTPDNPQINKALVDTLVATAKEAVKKHDFKAAFDAYDSALQVDPTNTEARNGREGLAHYEQASKERQARANSQFQAAKKAMDQGDNVAAYHAISSVLDLNPNYPQAAAMKSQVQAQLEAKAKPFYDDGVRLYNAGKLPEAINAFNQALAQFPDYAPTIQFLSQAQTKIRAEAQELYRKGYISEGLGHYKEALDYYRKTLALLPGSNEEYHKKAADKISQLRDKVK